MSAPNAEHYDKMEKGVEYAGDPLPRSLTAIRARQRAIRECRLVVKSSASPGKERDEYNPPADILKELKEDDSDLGTVIDNEGGV